MLCKAGQFSGLGVGWHLSIILPAMKQVGAAEIGDRPTRPRISLFKFSYESMNSAGIEKYACWGSPVNKGARIRAQSSRGHLSLSATTSNILRKFSASS